MILRMLEDEYKNQKDSLLPFVRGSFGMPYDPYGANQPHVVMRSFTHHGRAKSRNNVIVSEPNPSRLGNLYVDPRLYGRRKGAKRFNDINNA